MSDRESLQVSLISSTANKTKKSNYFSVLNFDPQRPKKVDFNW